MDGQYDCAGKTDELKIYSNGVDGFYCPLTPSKLNCDESKYYENGFACDDRQFVVRIDPSEPVILPYIKTLCVVSSTIYSI